MSNIVEAYMEGKMDLRVFKTRKALAEAMMQSLREKPFEDITVQYICDKAMVRRATFYTHFADKYALFSYTVRMQYQAFPSFQQFESTDSAMELFHHIVEDAVNFLAENIVIFRSVISSQMTYVILNTIRSELEQDLLPHIETSLHLHDIHGRSPKFIFHFYLHGIFGSFLWWVREDCPIPKEELVAQIQSMLHIGWKGAVQK